MIWFVVVIQNLHHALRAGSTRKLIILVVCLYIFGVAVRLVQRNPESPSGALRIGATIDTTLLADCKTVGVARRDCRLSMNKALSRLERGQFTHETRSSFCNVMAHRGKSTLLVEPKLDHNTRHTACCELGGLIAVIRIPEICS
jgi:hypothetical protein